MKRKLVKQGRNALTVTLPASWTKKFGLKAGDEVEVEEVGKNISIGSEKQISLNKIEFDMRKLKGLKTNYISYFYHKGFDEIRLFYDDPDFPKITKDKLNNLMGFEIIETGKNYIRIKNLSEAIENEFDLILRRIFLMMKSMSEECFNAITSEQFTRLKEIREMERTNNKLTDFCIRILNKKGYKEYQKTMPLYLIVRELEKICDIFKHICDHLTGNKSSINKDTLEYFKEVNNYWELFYKIFYKFDVESLNEFSDKRKDLLELGYKLLASNQEPEKTLIHHLINLVTQIFELKGPYLEMNLQN